MSIWGWFWLGWALYGLMVEIPAVLNDKRGDTLSEHLKWLLCIGRPLTWRGKLVRFVALAFWIWLPIHIAGYA